MNSCTGGTGGWGRVMSNEVWLWREVGTMCRLNCNEHAWPIGNTDGKSKPPPQRRLTALANHGRVSTVCSKKKPDPCD